MFNQDWIDKTRHRIKLVFEGKIPDRVPGHGDLYYLYSPPIKKLIESPEEQFNFQLKRMHAFEELGADVIPGIWPMLGAVVYPSIFGAELEFYENDWPAIVKYPLQDIKDVHNLQIPDIRKKGLGPHLVSMLEYFVTNARGKIAVASYDNDGPLYLAFGLMGKKLLYEFYDHPYLVKKLLKLCSDSIIEFTKVQREITGHTLQECPITYDDLSIPDGYGGIYAGETYSHMLSVEMYREIVKPIDIEFFKTFGGGAIHTCGNHIHLFREFLDLPVSLIRFYAGSYDAAEAKQIVDNKVVLMGTSGRVSGGGLPNREDLVYTLKTCATGGKFILAPNGDARIVMQVVSTFGHYDSDGFLNEPTGVVLQIQP